jgi:hypothetical protein
MASGVTPVYKWDGVKRAALQAGVPAPTTAVTLAASGSGSISGTYTAYQRFLDADGNAGNLSPISNEVEVEDVLTFTYSSVPIPADDRVATRQIIRNTNGQTNVYYVDVETDDLSATTFTSTKDDDSLSAQTSVALFSTDGVSLADKFGEPPDDKPVVVFYSNRLFFLGESLYSEGHVAVTYGSTTVTGVGTSWTEAMAGRLLYMPTEPRSYEIDSVDESAQTLTLTEIFEGATNLFRTYTIRPTPDRRLQVQYSEAGQFEAVPTSNALDVGSSEDLEEENLAGFAAQSYLFIAQRRHIYRMTFLDNPQEDGGVFLSARRGTVNNRCWVNVDGWTYLLDDRGVYRFDGSDNTEDLSAPVHDLLFLDKQDGELRINWKASKLFFVNHDRTSSTIRWFVAFSGNYRPRHALCFNYQIPQWWIEEFPWPVGCGTEVKASTPHPLVVGTARKVFAMNQGTLDVTNAQGGPTRLSVASATLDSLSLDATAVLPSSGLVGAPVAVVDGRGKRQSRTIASVSGNTLRVTLPWTVQPDSTSTVQIGGIGWRWRSGWVRWLFAEKQLTRRVTCSFRPVSGANEMDLRIYRDYSESPDVAAETYPRTRSEESGIREEKNSPDREIDLSRTGGFSWLRLDESNDFDDTTPDVVSIEFRGYSGTDRVKLFEAAIEGAAQ